MLSLPGALLFGNLHIILIISFADTGLQNMLFLQVCEQSQIVHKAAMTAPNLPQSNKNIYLSCYIFC